MKTCLACNAPLEDDAIFCANCGQKQEVAEEAPVEEAPVEEAPFVQPTEPVAEKNSKKGFKKLLVPLIAAVALVALILIIVALSGGKSAPDGAVYFAENELFFTDFGKGGGTQFTENLDNGIEDIEDATSTLMALTILSNSGDRLFYPDRIDDDGYALYYKNFKKLDSEGVRVDANITGIYYISDNGNIVSYVKDGKLYKYDIKKDDKQKIASDVDSFYMSNDGKNLMYLNDEGDLYRYTKDKEKVDSEVDYVCYYSEDFNTLVYTKDSNLYLNKKGDNKVKIASDIYDLVYCYGENEIYYIKEDAVESKLSAFVNDDCKEEDANMVEPAEPERPVAPESPEYPYFFEFDSDEEYDAAYEAYLEAWDIYEAESDKYDAAMDSYWDAWDEYYDQNNAYENKLERDALREEIAKEVVEYTVYNLCYYDGKKEFVVCEDVERYIYDYSYSSPLVIFSQNVREENSGKYNLSEIYSIYSLKSDIEYSSDAAETVTYLAKKDKAYELVDVSEESTSFYFSNDDKTLYYVAEVDEDGYGELMSIDVKDKPGKSKLVDSDVYYFGARFVDDDVHVYYKEDDELFVNGKSVDWEVDAYTELWDSDSKTLYYVADWEDGEGTLKKYKNSKTATISDEVSSFVVMPNGDVAYIYDVNDNNYTGELMLFNGKKSKSIAYDVYDVAPINQGNRAYVWFGY